MNNGKPETLSQNFIIPILAKSNKQIPIIIVTLI